MVRTKPRKIVKCAGCKKPLKIASHPRKSPEKDTPERNIHINSDNVTYSILCETCGHYTISNFVAGKGLIR